MLHLDDHWIWDFWLIDDGPDHHVFFLKAPRSLGDPELRHYNSTIGHAVSTDLETWHQLPDALGTGPAGAWDDLSPWTGSVIRADDRWFLFYTGTSTVDDGLIQRIGAAVSDDLVHWERLPGGPLITSDYRFYERYGDVEWFDEAWRDPWLVAGPNPGETLAFICARLPTGPSAERGAIALARSDDLQHWTVEPPVYATGDFAQMEVPQVLEIRQRWYLLFCMPDWSHSQRWLDREGERRSPATTTYYVIGESPTGPFTTDPEPIGTTSGQEVLYAGKLHLNGQQPVFLATRLLDADGTFVGDLIDPRPVTIQPDGHLVTG